MGNNISILIVNKLSYVTEIKYNTLWNKTTNLWETVTSSKLINPHINNSIQFKERTLISIKNHKLNVSNGYEIKLNKRKDILHQ